MLKHLIERLVEQELNVLLERARVQPQLMYHGTTSKHLPKIFQLGMVPNPTQGRWKDDNLEQGASASAPSLRSLEGSYWTDNMATALISANSSRRAIGGEAAIVVAQIVPQSGKADEDDIRGPIANAFQTILIPYFGHREMTSIVWPLLGAIEADPKFYNKLVGEFAEYLHSRLKTSDKMPIDKKMMKDTFDATHQRLLGHVDAKEGREKWAYHEAYERWLENHMDWKKAREKAKNKQENEAIPRFDKVSGEKAFLEILDQLSRRYRKSAIPDADDKYRMRTNLRVTEPVGFKGRNKILAILVLNTSKTLSLVYGHLPGNAISDYSQFWGPEFQITDRKTGETIYNTLKEAAEINEDGIDESPEQRQAFADDLID